MFDFVFCMSVSDAVFGMSVSDVLGMSMYHIVWRVCISCWYICV